MCGKSADRPFQILTLKINLKFPEISSKPFQKIPVRDKKQKFAVISQAANS